jgi:hypothetical protein
MCRSEGECRLQVFMAFLRVYSRILCFVDCASLYNLANKANFVHYFSSYVYFISLHVSGGYIPIIRRNNSIYATLGICHSVWMTVWYARWNCAPSWFYLQTVQ